MPASATPFDHDFEAVVAGTMTEDAFEIDPNLGPTEFQVSASERAYEKFLADVERLTGASVDGGGEPLLMSDAALNAFEEGVSASDYALQLQAAQADDAGLQTALAAIHRTLAVS